MKRCDCCGGKEWFGLKLIIEYELFKGKKKWKSTRQLCKICFIEAKYWANIKGYDIREK